MVFNIVTGQNLESHDAPSAHTPPSASLKENFHFTCCHSVHILLVFLLFFSSKF